MQSVSNLPRVRVRVKCNSKGQRSRPRSKVTDKALDLKVPDIFRANIYAFRVILLLSCYYRFRVGQPYTGQGQKSPLRSKVKVKITTWSRRKSYVTRSQALNVLAFSGPIQLSRFYINHLLISLQRWETFQRSGSRVTIKVKGQGQDKKPRSKPYMKRS